MIKNRAMINQSLFFKLTPKLLLIFIKINNYLKIER